MKTRLVLSLLACSLALPAFAQKEPAEVTDGEIRKYKALAENGCRQGGEKRGDPKERVDAFCSCLVATMDKSMKRPEWQQAYFYSINGQADRERQVLEAHLNNAALTCRPPAPAAAAPEGQSTPAADAPKPKLDLKVR